MAEEQAIDRVHRMGQVHEVIATRYIVQESIEEVCRVYFFQLTYAIDIIAVCSKESRDEVDDYSPDHGSGHV